MNLALGCVTTGWGSTTARGFTVGLGCALGVALATLGVAALGFEAGAVLAGALLTAVGVVFFAVFFATCVTGRLAGVVDTGLSDADGATGFAAFLAAGGGLVFTSAPPGEAFPFGTDAALRAAGLIELTCGTASGVGVSEGFSEAGVLPASGWLTFEALGVCGSFMTCGIKCIKHLYGIPCFRSSLPSCPCHLKGIQTRKPKGVRSCRQSQLATGPSAFMQGSAPG